MIRLLRVLLLTSAILATPAFSQDRGEQFTHFAGFTLGVVNLANIQRALGPSQIRESGDAGEYDARICYALPTGTIQFFSGEMGGDDHQLLGFTLSRAAYKPCAQWPEAVRAPKLQIGNLFLGMSARAFSSAIKRHIEWRKHSGYANFEYRRPLTKQELAAVPADIRAEYVSDPAKAKIDGDLSIYGTFNHGHLVSLTIAQTESL
jgi:hypothetical protein